MQWAALERNAHVDIVCHIIFRAIHVCSQDTGTRLQVYYYLKFGEYPRSKSKTQLSTEVEGFPAIAYIVDF